MNDQLAPLRWCLVVAAAAIPASLLLVVASLVASLLVAGDLAGANLRERNCGKCHGCFLSESRSTAVFAVSFSTSGDVRRMCVVNQPSALVTSPNRVIPRG